MSDGICKATIDIPFLCHGTRPLQCGVRQVPGVSHQFTEWHADPVRSMSFKYDSNSLWVVEMFDPLLAAPPKLQPPFAGAIGKNGALVGSRDPALQVLLRFNTNDPEDVEMIMATGSNWHFSTRKVRMLDAAYETWKENK
jgi:hypothetical protein